MLTHTYCTMQNIIDSMITITGRQNDWIIQTKLGKAIDQVFDPNTYTKRSLYTYLATLPGVTRETVKSCVRIYGIVLKSPVTNIESVATDVESIANNVETPFNFQKELLRLKEQKLKQQMILAEQQRATELKLAEQKKATELELAERQRATEFELAEHKKATEFELKKMDIDLAKYLKDRDIEQSNKRMEFEREENNKNRLLTMMTSKYNRYLDLEAYGTNSFQFITGDSLKRVIGFNMFDQTNKINKEHIECVSNAIDQACVEHAAYKGDTMVSIDGIDASKVSNIIDEVSKHTSHSLDKVLQQVDAITIAPKNEYIRVKMPTIEECISKQDCERYGSPKAKAHYVRAINNIRMDNDNLIIDCYCCSNPIRLDASETHRCHNIPKSKGGDWSKSNIYLCCATCNQSMGDTKSVQEFKVELYLKINDLD